LSEGGCNVEILQRILVDIGVIKTKVEYIEKAQQRAVHNSHYWVTTAIAVTGVVIAAFAIWT